MAESASNLNCIGQAQSSKGSASSRSEAPSPPELAVIQRRQRSRRRRQSNSRRGLAEHLLAEAQEDWRAEPRLPSARPGRTEREATLRRASFDKTHSESGSLDNDVSRTCSLACASIRESPESRPARSLRIAYSASLKNNCAPDEARLLPWADRSSSHVRRMQRGERG